MEIVYGDLLRGTLSSVSLDAKKRELHQVLPTADHIQSLSTLIVCIRPSVMLQSALFKFSNQVLMTYMSILFCTLCVIR